MKKSVKKGENAMRSPKLIRGGTRARSRRVVGYLLLALIIGLFMNRERLLNQVRFFNRRFLNPFMLRYAGRQGAYDAVVQHVGRTSGKPYRTPVVATPVEGGFVIPLPYGTKVDWLRNVQAAGAATLTWNGSDYAITEPTEIDAATARTLLPSAKWWTYRLFGITHFLRVGSPSAKPVEAPGEVPAAEPALI